MITNERKLQLEEQIKRLQTEILEQARIIGISGERELSLVAEIERLKVARGDSQFCTSCNDVAKDIEKLTHELDVIWNGDGAAPKASLCDVVSQLSIEVPCLRIEHGSLVAQSSIWFSLLMNAAAELEDAANCLQDVDAKAKAINAAQYFRERANESPIS